MKVFLFDMDGVIVDSERYWEIYGERFISRFSGNISDEKKNEAIGIHVNDLYSMLKTEITINMSREEFMKKYDEIAEVIYKKKCKLIPGVLELLRKLSDNKIPVALVSSSRKSWVDMVLDRFSLRIFFSSVISGDDLTDKGKPEPDIYLFAAKKMGASPKDCIVIEDSKNGILSAKAAGIFCVGFKNGFNDEQDLSEADRIVRNLNEIEVVK